MRLSIIIPTLNEAAAIGATLAALAPLRARGHEVLVADGGSEDGTRDIARPLADRVIVAPRGRARQMNAGAAAATGDALLFLHADTRLPAARRSVDVSIHWRKIPGDDSTCASRGARRCCPVIAFFMNLRSRLTGIATGDQAIFVRRADVCRLSGDRADGGHRIQQGDEAPRRAGGPARESDDLRPALGAARASCAPWS